MRQIKNTIAQIVKNKAKRLNSKNKAKRLKSKYCQKSSHQIAPNANRTNKRNIKVKTLFGETK